MGMLSSLLEHQSCGTCHLQAPEQCRKSQAHRSQHTEPNNSTSPLRNSAVAVASGLVCVDLLAPGSHDTLMIVISDLNVACFSGFRHILLGTKNHRDESLIKTPSWFSKCQNS